MEPFWIILIVFFSILFVIPFLINGITGLANHSIEVERKKRVSRPVALVCGKCGTPFTGWQPGFYKAGNSSKIGYFRKDDYTSNKMSENKIGAIHVSDRDGPVGVCRNCWLVFCQNCANGRELFVEGTYILDVPFFDCPYCGFQLDIHPDYFGVHIEES